MNLAICTISFRHHLISIEEVARWAQAHRFQGIELWGAHARSLAGDEKYGAEWLAEYGLAVLMLSDYLPLDAPLDELWAKLEQLSALARRWETRKLRTFAGRLGSAETSAAARARVVERLRGACQRLADRGQLLLVETHPSTLADTAESTLQLLAEVDHPALRVNFDVLHVWEAGDDPLGALARLRPHVSHLHLKNVSRRERLDVFAPANVYSAAGSRVGMVPLFEGVFDYQSFLADLPGDSLWDASLEWFGDDVKGTLSRDRRAIELLAGGAGVAQPVRGQRLTA
ncbi:MAG: 3-dehydroshikimate dehydratase [Polyangiaceae bacterium]|jgi:3-dehydroshikimate dehydratase|nr:3-dehydroshikimate dehydratase [Polyangiaceae bacterium]